MSLLSFLSVLILVITIVTLIFGVIAYFLYKAREKNKKKDMGEEEKSYEDILEETGDEYIYYE